MSTIEQQRTLDGTWKADKVHSHLGFAVRHMGVSLFRGSLEDFDATLVGRGESFELSGTALAASIETPEPNLSGHLQSPEFFDVERTPQITLESTSVERDGDQVTIAADLTIRGATRPVVLRGNIADVAEDPYGNMRVGLSLETTIDRTEFGLNWNAPLPGGGLVLANDVRLTADLEFIKEA
jgi:polyisoprenoid-binding protein YceI